MENKQSSRQISLILSDLDGTLFHNDKSISDYSKNVIAAAQKNGLLFGISTSRALSNAEKFLEGINPDILITNGGGMAFVQGKKIYNAEFSVEEARTLISACFEVFGPDAIISLDNEYGLYSNSKEELGDKYWSFNDFSDFREPAMKLCVQSLELEKIKKVAGSLDINEIDFLPFSDIPWYKLSKKSATKERAIKALCDYLKLSPEKIVAFGDDFNDIGMLQLCGKGIAMENAIPEVRAVADEICLSNEKDGLARWIEANFQKC
ncbi:MAG: HAD family hydrolase [Treponema sp.]|nr:HAD family hydrolase [Treponema sp.]